jgi:hypothetical protein
VVGYREKITAEFDEVTRILHLTAEARLTIETLPELIDLCATVRIILQDKCESDRCYMIVDLTKFSIDTNLLRAYMDKIRRIESDFIDGRGLVRYDYEITGATIEIGYAPANAKDPLLFATKKEALAYIGKLSSSRDRADSGLKMR